MFTHIPSQVLADAIADSISRNHIARVDYTEALYALASAECEGEAVENNGDIDIWGVNLDGEEWRLRLVKGS